MTNKMDAAAEAVRSILPSPYRLSDGPAERHGVRHRESGGPARFAVVDGLDRQACDLVITYETARDDRVTYDALYSADMPGRLRHAIAEGGTLWVLSGASRSGLGRLRPSFARARRLTVWGGVLLGVGLVLAFFSSHLAALVMGATNLGFAV